MPLRPESSVSCGKDESGEIVFACDRPGPVVHRTPEELGIPRVLLPDRPRAKEIRPDWGAGGASMKLAGVKRDAPKVDAVATVCRAPREVGTREALEALARASAAALSPKIEKPENPELAAAAIAWAQSGGDRGNRPPRKEEPVRKIRGVEVRMPAEAVMGAELIDLIADEDLAKSGEENSVTVAEDLKAKVLAEPDAPAAELVSRYGVSRSQVYSWRYEAKKKGGAKQKPKARPKTAIQRVEIDPQREGTASSLINALAKRDAAVAIVKLDLALSPAELAAIVEKLNPAQQSAFFSAGLKAALLA